jgi:hypothetical protein
MMLRVCFPLFVCATLVAASACERQAPEVPSGEGVGPAAALVGTWRLDGSALADTESFRGLSDADRVAALQQIKDAATEMRFDGTRLTTTTHNRGRKMSHTGTYTLEQVEADGTLVLATRTQGREAPLRARVDGDRLTLEVSAPSAPAGAPGADPTKAPKPEPLVFVRR